MNDLISRQAAIDAINKAYDRETLLTLFMRSTAVRAIRNMPSAQPDPVKHGAWVYKGARGRFPICECSVCGNAENADWAILGDNVNYCPNCGARMDGGEDV